MGGAVFGCLIIPDLNAVAVMDQDIDSTSHGGLLQGEFHSGLYLLDLHHVIRSLFYESDQFVSSGLLYFLASIADDERQKEMIIQCGFDSAYRVESLMLHHIRSQTEAEVKGLTIPRIL